MELYEAIAKRRTVRGFSEPASEGALRRIILAGSMAASPINSQPWEFIVVEDRAIVEQIAEHKFQQNQKLFPGPSELWGEDQEAVEKLLGLPEGYKLTAVVLVGKQKGYPKIPKLKRRPDWSWLHQNRFGK
ncbi:MAG: nitroreductase family protein [Thermodesulfobacteriota bacterium]